MKKFFGAFFCSRGAQKAVGGGGGQSFVTERGGGGGGRQQATLRHCTKLEVSARASKAEPVGGLGAEPLENLPIRKLWRNLKHFQYYSCIAQK